VVKKAGKMYQNHPAKATETDSILAQCGNQGVIQAKSKKLLQSIAGRF
jgi:hypothetical protein